MDERWTIAMLIDDLGRVPVVVVPAYIAEASMRCRIA
jgi:hypothetical protein